MQDFGGTVEYAACCLSSNSITFCLNSDILEYLLDSIASEDRIKSLLGCRMLFRLLDKNKNYDNFEAPRIFFSNTDYSITINTHDPDERILIDNYRELIEKSLLIATKLHSKVPVNLKAIYSILCMIVVGIPCGFTAASVICILIQIQKHAIMENENLETSQFNHLHAMVISVMTLICWTHRATSLSRYVSSLVTERYDKAPHLNPPLKVNVEEF